MTEAKKITQVRIPASVYAESRIEAGRRQVSFNELVVEALKLLLEKAKGDAVHE